MASIKAQGKSRAKEWKAKKFLGPETDPTNYATLYEEEFHLPWNSLHSDKQTLYIEKQQREASASNTPITMGTVPTAAELAQILHDLGVAMGQLTTQVANLSAATNTSVHTTAWATKLAVARPKPWNGKGGSIEARFFLAAFFNYARSKGEALNDWDPIHSQWMWNHVKWIAAILNLMKDEACTWALPYLEDLSQGGSPLTGDYDNFITAFNKRFAPHDLTETARDVLKHIKQGKSSVAEYQARWYDWYLPGLRTSGFCLIFAHFTDLHFWASGASAHFPAPWPTFPCIPVLVVPLSVVFQPRTLVPRPLRIPLVYSPCIYNLEPETTLEDFPLESSSFPLTFPISKSSV